MNNAPGTSAFCSGRTATPVYYSWWESLPATENPVASVKPGDEMSLDISYHARPAAHFIILLTDDSKQVIDQNVTVNHEPLSEAECIVEAPTKPHRALGLTFRVKVSSGNPSPGGIPWTVTWRHPGGLFKTPRQDDQASL